MGMATVLDSLYNIKFIELFLSVLYGEVREKIQFQNLEEFVKKLFKEYESNKPSRNEHEGITVTYILYNKLYISLFDLWTIILIIVMLGVGGGSCSGSSSFSSGLSSGHRVGFKKLFSDIGRYDWVGQLFEREAIA